MVKKNVSVLNSSADADLINSMINCFHESCRNPKVLQMAVMAGVKKHAFEHGLYIATQVTLSVFAGVSLCRIIQSRFADKVWINMNRPNCP
jgi:hypothetical protein